MGQRVRCGLCDSVIESKHRHDFVTCFCGNLSVDGGNDYLKLSFIENNWEVVSITERILSRRINNCSVEYEEVDGSIVDEDGYLISSVPAPERGGAV